MKTPFTRYLAYFASVTAALFALSPAAHAAPVSGMGTWQTTLQARDLDGNGSTDAYYDSTLNITWLDVENRNRTLSEQQSWVDSLAPGGVQGWRLPTMRDSGDQGCDFGYADTDCGYNVQTRLGDFTYSEMAHLFYVTLGNLAGYDAQGQERAGTPGIDFGLVNTGPLEHFVGGIYFTSVPNAALDGYTWTFNAAGLQFYRWNNDLTRALAVHDGDVGNAVPAPAAWILVLSALALLAACQTRRQRNACS
jgi:hypothetical protein